MTVKERYQYRKENGLCVVCGKPREQQSRAKCSSCLDKAKIYMQETRKICRKNRICPVCGKRKLYGNERNCLECSAKNYEKKIKENGKYKESRKMYIRTRYERLKKQGICTNCAKRSAVTGKTKCSICAEKQRNLQRTYRADVIPRAERFSYGVCYICGKPLDGESKKLCKQCSERAASHLEGHRSTSFQEKWRKDNKVAFKKFKNNEVV